MRGKLLLAAFVAGGAVACAPGAAAPTPPAPRALPEAPRARPGPAADACSRWPLERGCVRELAGGTDEICALTRERAFCWGPGASAQPPDAFFDANRGRIEVVPAASRRRHGGSRWEGACRPGDMKGIVVRCDTLSGGDYYLDATPAFGLASAGDIERLVTTTESACALVKGSVYCFGGTWSSLRGERGVDRFQGQPDRVALDHVTDLVARGRTVCALAGGEVYCWGGGRYFPPGVLAQDRTRFVAAALTTSGDFACFLGDDGRVTCGLRNDYRVVAGLEDVKQIVAQSPKICARRGDGQVVCVAPDGTSEDRPFLAPAKQLVDSIPCALLIDGRVRCDTWEHGDGTAPPTEIAGLGVARTISSDGCAANERGELVCWGYLGAHWVQWTGMGTPAMGAVADFDLHPQRIAGPKDVVELSHGCARSRSGKIWFVALATGADRRRMRLRASTVPGAVGAVSMETGLDTCVARRADGSAFILYSESSGSVGPFAIAKGPPHLEPWVADVKDELGVGFAARTFTLGLASGFRCVLGRAAGVLCRNAELHLGGYKLYGPPFDPLVRSTLPLRVIPQGS